MENDNGIFIGKGAAFIAGIAGALISSLFGPKRPKWQVIVFVLMGGIMAEYTHKLIADALGYSQHSIAFAFWAGIFGMAFVAKCLEVVYSFSGAKVADSLINRIKGGE